MVNLIQNSLEDMIEIMITEIIKIKIMMIGIMMIIPTNIVIPDL